jgi:hypothetical protein
MKYCCKLIGLFFCLICCLLFVCCNNKEKPSEVKEEKDRTMERLQAKADTAAIYCKDNNMNTDICFLVDMSVHSGKHRLFAWSLKENKVLFSGLCCHGKGGKSTSGKPEFSNVNGSNCTSLGKYKLGIRSYSKWGINIHYKMHGLEDTNDNAYARYVVFHSFGPVPDGEIHPFHVPMGWSQGCPVVSDNTMRKADELLKNIDTKEPVLFWIYY